MESLIKLVITVVIYFGLGYYLASLVATRIKLSRRQTHNPTQSQTGPSFLPPVSILKPLCGADGNLLDNLRSFVKQDYPQFEIIFGLQSVSDPAMPIVKQIQQEYPEADIKLIVSNVSIGYNPKINNLAGMLPQAQFEYLVISDSNVRVAPDYLARNIHYFRDRKVGLVTNLVRGVGGLNFGSTLEKLHLNSFVIGSVCLLDTIFGIKIVVGKSIFLRKSDLEKWGGLDRLKNYLAEDYVMGKLCEENGQTVIVSPDYVDNMTYSWSHKQFLNRHTRWGKVRWSLSRIAYIGEMVSNFSFWALVLALMQDTFSAAALTLLKPWAIKIAGDLLLNHWLAWPVKWHSFALSPIKDLVIALIWPVPILHSKTRWRGNRLRVTKDSLLLPAERPSPNKMRI